MCVFASLFEHETSSPKLVTGGRRTLDLRVEVRDLNSHVSNETRRTFEFGKLESSALRASHTTQQVELLCGQLIVIVHFW